MLCASLLFAFVFVFVHSLSRDLDVGLQHQLAGLENAACVPLSERGQVLRVRPTLLSELHGEKCARPVAKLRKGLEGVEREQLSCGAAPLGHGAEIRPSTPPSLAVRKRRLHVERQRFPCRLLQHRGSGQRLQSTGYHPKSCRHRGRRAGGVCPQLLLGKVGGVLRPLRAGTS